MASTLTLRANLHWKFMIWPARVDVKGDIKQNSNVLGELPEYRIFIMGELQELGRAPLRPTKRFESQQFFEGCVRPDCKDSLEFCELLPNKLLQNKLEALPRRTPRCITGHNVEAIFWKLWPHLFFVTFFFLLTDRILSPLIFVFSTFSTCAKLWFLHKLPHPSLVGESWPLKTHICRNLHSAGGQKMDFI